MVEEYEQSPCPSWCPYVMDAGVMCLKSECPLYDYEPESLDGSDLDELARYYNDEDDEETIFEELRHELNLALNHYDISYKISDLNKIIEQILAQFNVQKKESVKQQRVVGDV